MILKFKTSDGKQFDLFKYSDDFKISSDEEDGGTVTIPFKDLSRFIHKLQAFKAANL
jgi:hypothetical protein